MEASLDGPDGCRRGLFSPLFALVFLAAALSLIAVILYATPFGGSAKAQTYLSPHGAYSEHTQLCEICHATHEASSIKLVRGTPESALCFTCHNGTASSYNIEVEMNLGPTGNAMHPITVNLPYNNSGYNYTPRTTAGIAPPGPYACSQCHNPHGDQGFGKLLRAAYDTSEYVTYTTAPDPYQQCWTCHRPSAIIDDAVYFPKHNKHIVLLQASCSACHASPHGVANTALVKFNSRYVTASASLGSGPTYVDNGVSHGTCTLTCHGVDHTGFSY